MGAVSSVLGVWLDGSGAASYRRLLERFVGPMSAGIHSKYRVVDAAQVMRQGELGSVPQVPTRASLVDLEHRAIAVVHHLLY